MSREEALAFYEQTSLTQWRRSNKEYICVADMGKFHLINAARKLERLGIANLKVYTGICQELCKQRKYNYVAKESFELTGAL